MAESPSLNSSAPGLSIIEFRSISSNLAATANEFLMKFAESCAEAWSNSCTGNYFASSSLGNSRATSQEAAMNPLPISSIN